MKLMACGLMMLALVSGCVTVKEYRKVVGERNVAVEKEKEMRRSVGVMREGADFGEWLVENEGMSRERRELKACEEERGQLRRMFTITTGEQRKARVDK